MMQFRLNYTHPVGSSQISHTDTVLMMGSCFAENIGEKLRENKFNCLVNPNGILFNPISIAFALESYINKPAIKEQDIVYSNSMFCSLNHHGSYSNSDKGKLLDTIHDSIQNATEKLKKAEYLIITFGSSNVFRYKNTGQIVANCHKLAQNQFTKEQLQPDLIIETYNTLINKLKAINPKINILFTVSPVKYLRDGLIENNLSKAVLIYSIHQIIKSNTNCIYFPAYEIVNDDLRDYRFYKEDMAHPTEQAINYVWEQFSNSYFTEQTKQLNEKILGINLAAAHRPFHSDAEAHHLFKNNYLQKCIDLKKEFPFLALENEINYFTAK